MTEVRVGASVFVYWGNRLLMGRRTKDGTWGMPGGAQEVGETLLDCARRELLEEVNLDLPENRFVEDEEFIRMGRNGDLWRDIHYRVQVTEEDLDFLVRDDRSFSEMDFFPIGQLPSPLFGPMEHYVTRYPIWEPGKDAM